MKTAYMDSTARRLSQDLKAYEDRARLERTNHRVLSVRSLRSLLPDRYVVDTIVKQYFVTFETTFRILHVPTFSTAYDTYWDTESVEDTDMDALILAVLACTICLSTHTTSRYSHIGSTFHVKAHTWILGCEAWLKRQSNKHRSLASIQVRCLRLLAYATASFKIKEYYQEVQAHASFMRSACMHIDPTVFGTRCTPFEGEMRRRLWATTMEIELQASIDKGELFPEPQLLTTTNRLGTPSMLSSLSYDCAPPRNINDIELHTTIEELPPSRSITTYTDTSFLCVAMQTMELRAKMCHKVNNLKESSDMYDALDDEDAIRQHISKIPHWTDPRSVQARTLLELQLTQFMTILHAPRVLQAEFRQSSHRRYAMVTALEAAAKTIELHHTLATSGNFALVLTRNDYFRSGLLICHVAYHARRANGKCDQTVKSRRSRVTDTVMMRLAKLFFDDSMAHALLLQEERAMRPGRGSEYFWYVSAAVSLVGTQYKPSEAEDLTRQAVDRVAKLLYRVLSLQDDPSEESLATEVLLEERRAPLTVNTALQELLTADVFADSGVPLDAFDFNETSEFMMDDLCFFGVPPLHNGQSFPAF
jgi:hypothetical protein